MKRKHRFYDSWEDLIEDKTKRSGDCLEWQAGRHAQGYPMIRWGGRMVQVARQQIEEKTGQKLDGRNQRVKNRCGNLSCVNPDHYIVADYGSKEWNCVNHLVYSEEDEADICRIYDEFESSTGTKYGYQVEVKRKYPNISRTTILKFINKHLKKDK